MKEEENKIRFIIYMNIFSFTMLLLVLSNNIIIMLIGWEGVGVSSYLLINYWNTRLQANKSAIKAILYNKIGDIFLIMGIIYIINYNYNMILFDNNYIINNNIIVNDYIIICIIIAAIAKSAQFGFHCWLGDAMEGPTPVSALLHAATMVTAGIYLLFRILPIYIYSSYIYNILSIIGILTIILGGFISLFQNDIKKIIAFSTCSQLGYMLYANSIGLYENSYNHLIIHGYFKALLFLSAGILIHAFHNQQDLRKFGSFIFNYPIIYLYFLIGTLSIISLPFFSGFYSKDLILENTFFSYNFIYFISILGALLTVSYSLRLLYLVFFNKPKSLNIISNHINDLYFNTFNILLIGSLIFGYLFKSLFFYSSFSSFFSFSPIYSLDSHFIPHSYHLLPFILCILGTIIGISLDYLSIFKYNIIYYYIPLISLFNKKFYIDWINNYIWINRNLNISYNILFKLIDRGIYEIFGTIGLYRTSLYLISIENYTINNILRYSPIYLSFSKPISFYKSLLNNYNFFIFYLLPILWLFSLFYLL